MIASSFIETAEFTADYKYKLTFNNPYLLKIIYVLKLDKNLKIFVSP